MSDTVELDSPEFDEVVRDHPLVARRLPVLRNHHPRWKYDIALVVNPDDDLWGVSLEPTAEESEQLVAYLEYRLRYYNDGWRQRMLDRYPFDIDSSVNTFTFRKCPDVGWQYNARTWTMHVWFPQRGLHEQRYATLEALLDKICTFGADGEPPMQKWLDFKAESDAFGGETMSENLANACKCGDCYHPAFGPNTDGEPCEWCWDCACSVTEHHAWTDRMGDVWRYGIDGLMHTPETAPFPRGHVEKKWGPLRLARVIPPAKTEATS